MDCGRAGVEHDGRRRWLYFQSLRRERSLTVLAAGLGSKRRKNIGTSCPIFDWDAHEPGDPDDRHAVGRTQIAQQQRFAKFIVLQTCDQEIEVWSRNDKRHPRGGSASDLVQDCGNFDGIDRQPEDAIHLPRQFIQSRRQFGLALWGRIDGFRQNAATAVLRNRLLPLPRLEPRRRPPSRTALHLVPFGTNHPLGFVEHNREECGETRDASVLCTSRVEIVTHSDPYAISQ